MLLCQPFRVILCVEHYVPTVTGSDQVDESKFIAMIKSMAHRTGHRPDEGSGNPKRLACSPTNSTGGRSSSTGSSGSRYCNPIFVLGREDEYDLTSLTDVRQIPMPAPDLAPPSTFQPLHPADTQ